MIRTNLDRTTFAACQAYDNAGNPVKPMRNVLAELGCSKTGANKLRELIEMTPEEVEQADAAWHERVKRVAEMVETGSRMTNGLKEETDFHADHRKTVELVECAFISMSEIMRLIKDM